MKKVLGILLSICLGLTSFTPAGYAAVGFPVFKPGGDFVFPPTTCPAGTSTWQCQVAYGTQGVAGTPVNSQNVSSYSIQSSDMGKTVLNTNTGGCTTPVLVQKSGVGAQPGGASSTISVTITGVTAGNDLIAEIFGGDTAATPTYTVSDGTSYTVDVDANGAQNGGSVVNHVGIARLHNVSAGSHTVTATSSAGNFNVMGYIIVLEVSGLSSAAPAKNSQTGTSSSPTPGSTTPATSCSFAASVVFVESNANPTVFGDPPTGYTNAALETNGTSGGGCGFCNGGGAGDYKAFTTTSAENPSYATYSFSLPTWVVGLAIYQGNGSNVTYTIPAFGTLAVPVGNCFVIANAPTGGTITLQITTDTLYWLPTGGTGARSIAAFGAVTICKWYSTTQWTITSSVNTT